MNRRQMVTSGSTMIASLVATSAWAATAKKKNPSTEHQHTNTSGTEGESCHEMMMETSAEVIRAAEHCVTTADICLAHCIQLLGEGDKVMAACAKRVIETKAICQTLATLASQKSTLLPKFAAVAKEACKACEEECRKHESHHKECKDCAEACAECVQACKGLLAKG